MATVSRTEVFSEEMLLAQGKDSFIEIANGEFIKMAPAGAQHGKIGARIIWMLMSHVEANKLGDVFTDQTTYVLEGTPQEIVTMRVPDVSFIAAANLPDETPVGFWFQAPDLAVEVISPSEKSGETQAKLNDYFGAGTHEVWVVYPELAQIVVHKKGSAIVLDVEDTLSSEELLAGFALKLSEVFA